jgi:glyoxylase-like metal-dependent hydrolase (beta-lactamase superfamily II)
MIAFETITTQGDLQQNCYLVWCTKKKIGAVIDPGADADRIISRIHKLGIDIKFILLTHTHHDHIGAINDVQARTEANVAFHRLEPIVPNSSWDTTLLLEDAQIIQIGDETLKVLHTPGHTPGGICFYTPGFLFSGDTLFHTDVGFSNFPGGSFEDLQRSIREKLYVLNDDTKVYPGHEESTTIGEEKRHNLVVRALEFED